MKIALFEPITPGNVGAVARVMKNFGFNELLLIKPKCNHLSEEAVKRACHGLDVLNNARIISEKELFTNFVIGTTCKTTTRAHRQAVSSDNLSFAPENAVILFGREDNGLSNRLLSKCNVLTTINTGTNYNSLNLSHSVAIILYSLRKKQVIKNLADPKMKEAILKSFNKLSDKCSREKSTKSYLKNFINRSIVYEKEARAIMGLLKELLKKY
jgi:tRNA/rRNA methyltransferase